MSKWLIMLITGLTLGLGWAIRGHFGHWWGASWAGSMGALALLLAIGREDWIKRAPVLALLAAIGWGMGGIMSYGILVGYCRSPEVFNSAYGFISLFIVGGLYGFIGGGLFGLGLSSDENKKPDWLRLLLEMFVIGNLAYWFFITEMEWLMTPPRDEFWSICLGSASALAWYAYRTENINALRVAIYSGLGGGFGFALGNFFQTLGHISGISYNWWNVMEFTLGLLGGIGMAYGVISSNWSEKIEPNKKINWISLITLVFVIPAINIFQSFDSKKIIELAERLNISNAVQFAGSIQLKVWLILILFTVLSIYVWKKIELSDISRSWGILLLLLYSLLYTIFGNIRTGYFYVESFWGNSVTTYWIFLPIVIILLYIKRKEQYNLGNEMTELESWKYWVSAAIILVLFIFTLALVTNGIHDGNIRFHNRF
ncbi:MAG: hypothetical protein ABFS12_10680 [Bacteroidota bacterium]